MKKTLFFALAAVGMLSSCSQDDNVSPAIQEASNLVPIQLSLGTAQMQTRATGSGAVGDVDASKNMWKGQKVNVFMFKKATLELAKFEGEEIFNNKIFQVTDERASLGEGESNAVVAKTVDNSISYYPTQGSYDFWGYRLDGAETATPVNDGTTCKVDFTIDGSQDVMIAKAVPTAAQQAADAAACDRAYSAFAARHNIQPVLDFKHLLTRLKFFALAGNEDATLTDGGIKIDSVKVVSKTTGKLIVAYSGEEIADANRIEFDAATDSLALMERAGADVSAPLQKLTASQQPIWNTTTNKSDTLQLGESIIVSPENEYQAKIYLHQEKSVSTDPSVAKKNIIYGYDLTLKTPSNVPFKPGYSYNVYLTLWGLQEISVSMTLQPWQEDGNDATISIQPEDLVEF